MSPPLRIVHTVCHDQWGGLERRVYQEALWMSRRGHQPTIIAPKNSPLYRHSLAAGWHTIGLKFHRWQMLGDMLRLHRWLKQIQPQVLNTHGNTDTKVSLVAALGVQIPCTILSRHIFPPVRPTGYNRVLYRHLAQGVFTTSLKAAQGLIESLNLTENRVFSIPSGIQVPPSLLARPEAKLRLTQELGVPATHAIIGYVGRLDMGKGILDLVAALPQIHEIFPMARLVIIGAGNAQQAILTQAAALKVADRVHVMGFRDDPWPYYRALDCCVLASRENEGIPQTLLEAMFSQTPVVATHTGGIPEIVEHRITGLLVEPNSPCQLAEAIVDTLTHTDLCESRIAAALTMVQTHHTLDAMGMKILNVYRRYIQDPTLLP